MRMEQQLQSSSPEMQQMYNMLADLIKVSIADGQKASEARMAKLEASTAEIKAGQEASTAEIKAGQDAIISQLNANKQETDRKLDTLDAAYVQLNQELQEVKSNVTLLQNPPVEETQKVVEAVYAIVRPALQLDFAELANQGRRTLEERFEQFQGGFVAVEAFGNRFGIIEAEL